MHHTPGGAGKQTGPDSSNRGSCSAGWGALGVNQSWTAKLILIRRETERIRGEEWCRLLSSVLRTKRLNGKSQLGGQNIAANGYSQQKCARILPVFFTRTAVQVARIHYASTADCVYSFAYFRLSLNMPCHPVTLAYLFLSPADFDVACNLVRSIRIFRLKQSVN